MVNHSDNEYTYYGSSPGVKFTALVAAAKAEAAAETGKDGWVLVSVDEYAEEVWEDDKLVDTEAKVVLRR